LALHPVGSPAQRHAGPGHCLYIIGRSIQFGWRGGAAAAIGICCGCLFHVFGAAIGLSALLMASSAAFAAVKWAGAAYLLFTPVHGHPDAALARGPDR
jgi:threonine/homoserine/homoserine lactone efflux protein